MDKYAIIERTTIHHEGDERSRTHPGHGYPAYSETVETIRTFENQEEWAEYIERASLSPYPKEFTPIIYREIGVEKSIKLKY